MHKITIIALFIGAMLIAVTGCKPAPTNDSTAQNKPETATNEAASNTTAAAPDTENKPAETAPTTDNNTNDTAPADVKGAADDTANADDKTASQMPEIKPIETVIEFPGGEMHQFTLDWGKNINISYEYPQYNIYYEEPEAGVVPDAYQKITASFVKGKDLFFAKDNLENIWDYHTSSPDREEEYLDVVKASVTEHTDSILSVVQCFEWFMGGVMDGGCTGHVFNTKTGERITLQDYYKKDTKALKEVIKKAIIKEVGDNESAIEWDLFDKLEQFSYYIQEGKVHVVFHKYEIAIGAAGAFDIELP